MPSMRDLQGKDIPTWCPGCGDHGVLSAMKLAMIALDLEPHQLLVVSGIGVWICQIDFFAFEKGVWCWLIVGQPVVDGEVVVAREDRIDGKVIVVGHRHVSFRHSGYPSYRSEKSESGSKPSPIH